MATTSSPSTSKSTLPKVSSEDIIGQKTDLCISNAIVKAGLGFGGGVLLSFIIFRRRAFPVWLGTGFGLGSAWTDCERSFNPVAIPGVRIVSNNSTLNSTEPSVMEKLQQRTANLVEKGKEVSIKATEKTKETAKDVEQKNNFKIFSINEFKEKIKNDVIKIDPPKDCLSCKIIGSGTLFCLAGFSINEAFRLKRNQFQPSISPPRLRFAMLLTIGITSTIAGVYRLYL